MHGCNARGNGKHAVDKLGKGGPAQLRLELVRRDQRQCFTASHDEEMVSYNILLYCWHIISYDMCLQADVYLREACRAVRNVHKGLRKK